MWTLSLGSCSISWSHLCPSPSLTQQPGASWKSSHGHGILMPKVLEDFLPREHPKVWMPELGTPFQPPNPGSSAWMVSPHHTSGSSASLQLLFLPLGIQFTWGRDQTLRAILTLPLALCPKKVNIKQPWCFQITEPPSISFFCHRSPPWRAGCLILSEPILATADVIDQEAPVPTVHQNQITSRMLEAKAGSLPWATKFCGEAGRINTLILSCWPVGLTHCPTVTFPLPSLSLHRTELPLESGGNCCFLLC